MQKVRTALIGCGKVGHTHAGAFAELPESDFVAVCDSDLGRADEFAAQYGVKAYTDIAEMVTDAQVDAVSICTPHPLHAPLGIQAARAGADVLLEKPMASNLKDCDDMLAVADETGIKLGIISQRRLYEPVQRIRDAIDAGKIGTPALGTLLMLGWRDKAYYDSDPWRGSWAGEGGGVLVNQAPHQLDILQWLMGPIDEVFAYWENLNHPYIEVEDTALALIRFKNGGVGNIVASNSQKPGIYTKVHIHGSNGASVGVQTDGGSPFIAGMTAVLEPPVNDVWSVPGEEGLLEGWNAEDAATFESVDPATFYHKLQIQDFLQAILENRAPMVDGVEGRKAVELIEAIYRSQRDHAPVKFPLQAED